jgi:hypothetical protein
MSCPAQGIEARYRNPLHEVRVERMRQICDGGGALPGVRGWEGAGEEGRDREGNGGRKGGEGGEGGEGRRGREKAKEGEARFFAAWYPEAYLVLRL